MQQEAFILPAELKAIHDNVFINRSCKDIYPAYCGTCQKIKALLVSYSISLAHGCKLAFSLVFATPAVIDRPILPAPSGRFATHWARAPIQDKK